MTGWTNGGAVADRRREHAHDARHAARHVEVDVDPLPRPGPAAGRRGPLVEQDRAAQQVRDHVAPRPGPQRREDRGLDGPGRTDRAPLGEAAGPAEQRAQACPVARDTPGWRERLAERARQRPALDRVRRLRPLLDDLADHVEQDRRPGLEVAAHEAAGAMVAQQRHLRRLRRRAGLEQRVAQLLVGDAAGRVQGAVHVGEPRVAGLDERAAGACRATRRGSQPAAGRSRAAGTSSAA